MRLAACGKVCTPVLFVSISSNTHCPAFSNSIRSLPPGPPRRPHPSKPPPPQRRSPKEKLSMSNENGKSQRPQITPEVVQDSTPQPTTRPAEVARAEEHSHKVPEGRPSVVARPIVEVSPDVAPGLDTDRARMEAHPKPTSRPIVEVVPDVTPGLDTDRSRREAQPTPVARPIVEVVAEVQTPAFADGDRTKREAQPTPVARPIVEVVAEVQTPAFAHSEHDETCEEEAEVVAADSKK